MAKNSLPPHIRQLVDKNNFVIAIKTLSQEQNISLEAAKAQIDAYEASKILPVTNSTMQDTGETLVNSVDTHLQQQNIQRPLLPYWVKRVGVLLLIVGLLGWLMWRAFT